MRLLTILLTISLIPLVGCESRQLADQSMDLAMNRNNELVANLEKIAIQRTLNEYALKMKNDALANKDNEQALKSGIDVALGEYTEAIDTITMLTRTQHARINELFRIGRRYIWLQESAFTVISRDVKDAADAAKK